MPLPCFLRAVGQAVCIAAKNALTELVQYLPAARCRLLALENLQICRNCSARRILLDGEQRSALCVQRHSAGAVEAAVFPTTCRRTNDCCRTWYDEA